MSGIWLPIGALVLAIYIVVLFFIRGSVRNPETIIYKKLILFNLLHSVLAVCTYIFAMKAGNPYFTGLLQSLYLIIMTLMLLLLLKYLIEINKIKNKKKINIFFKAITAIIAVFIMVLPIDTIITGEIVKFNGPAYNVALLDVVLNTLLIIFFSLIFYKKNKNGKIKLLPFIILFALFIVDIIIRNYYPQVIMETFIFTLSYLVMYHTIENPDVKLIKQLNLAKNQVEKANKDKRNFISSMSHEIKTPLNAIVGFSECIKQEKDINSCYKDADDIIVASQNLLEIINGILDSNRMNLAITNYNSREVFEKSAKSVMKKISDKKIEFNYNISDDIPSVLQGDIGKLKQIINNILINAINYTEHGYINLDVTSVNNKETSKLIISIQDTGRGFKQEQIDKIFNNSELFLEDKNQLVDKVTADLILIKKYVEMMDGNIKVQSKYGEGTRYTIYINQKIVNDEHELARLKKEDYEVKSINLDNKKVLIVDDNKLNIKVCTKLLNAYNLDISAVESGLECLQLLKSGAKFNLILMDDLMPNMTGTETLANLKKEFTNFSIPTVVLTANNVVEKREEYLNSGFIDCLGKPIEKTQLNRVLVKYLGLDENKQNIKEKETDNQVAASEEIDLTGKKILIVDDNNLNLKVAENFIKPYKPIVETVNSGKECLMRTKTEKYDLILLDDMMPQLSGIETMQLLRKNKSFNTPIIVLTANAIDGAKENYLTAGFDDYLSKPIDREKLLDILKKNIFDKENSTNKQVDIKSMHTKEFLKQHGIMVEDGLEYLKTMDNYDNAVQEFLDSIAAQAVKITQYKTSHDLANYAVEVNNLRKKCRNLGINKLVDMAFNQELKSRDGSVKYIDEHFDEFLKEIYRYVKILKKYNGVNKK